jgi:hypothetical protein
MAKAGTGDVLASTGAAHHAASVCRSVRREQDTVWGGLFDPRREQDTVWGGLFDPGRGLRSEPKSGVGPREFGSPFPLALALA